MTKQDRGPHLPGLGFENKSLTGRDKNLRLPALPPLRFSHLKGRHNLSTASTPSHKHLARSFSAEPGPSRTVPPSLSPSQEASTATPSVCRKAWEAIQLLPGTAGRACWQKCLDNLAAGSFNSDSMERLASTYQGKTWGRKGNESWNTMDICSAETTL